MFPNNRDNDQPIQPENIEPAPQPTEPVFAPTPRQDITPPQPQPTPQPQSMPQPVTQTSSPTESTESSQSVDQPTPSIQPAPSSTPAIAISDDLPSNKPKLKKKKGLMIGIIAAAVVVVALVAAALWYFLIYNSPNDVVIDALTKALTSKSGTFDATVSSGSATQDLKLNFNKDSQATADLALDFPMGDIDQKFAINLAADKNNLYVKLNDSQKLMELLAGFSDDATDATATASSAAGKLDGKWIAITAADLRQMTGQNYTDQLKCVDQQVANFRDNGAISGEFAKVYSANPLFAVTARGSDASGNKYELKISPTKTIVAFLSALQNTKVFKGLDNCAKGQLATSVKSEIKDLNASKSSATKSMATFNVWIDGGSRTLNKIEITDTTSVKEKLVVTTKFNTNPKITMPKAQLTFNDWKNAITSLTTDTNTNTNTDTSTDTDTTTYNTPTVIDKNE